MARRKSAIITGGSKGIGRATAHRLAAAGYRVGLTSRSMERASQAASQIQQATGGTVIPLESDFSGLKNVKALANNIAQEIGNLDVVVNNAARIPQNRTLSEDGFEMQFAVNYLAHYLLTRLILEKGVLNPGGRIVNVTSQVHNRLPIDLDDLNSEKITYDRVDVYSRSKLALIYFTEELARRLEPGAATVNSVHPGVVATDLLADYQGFSRLRKIFRAPGGKDPEEGAEPIVRLATDSDVVEKTGRYFHRFDDRKPDYPDAEGDVGSKLWKISERLCGL